MSRQLAISAAFSVFAMSAFALFATAGESSHLAASPGDQNISGAPIKIETPEYLPKLSGLPAIID